MVTTFEYFWIQLHFWGLPCCRGMLRRIWPRWKRSLHTVHRCEERNFLRGSDTWHVDESLPTSWIHAYRRASECSERVSTPCLRVQQARNQKRQHRKKPDSSSCAVVFTSESREQTGTHARRRRSVSNHVRLIIKLRNCSGPSIQWAHKERAVCMFQVATVQCKPGGCGEENGYNSTRKRTSSNWIHIELELGDLQGNMWTDDDDVFMPATVCRNSV